MTLTDHTLPINSSKSDAHRFLLHAEKTILRHSNTLRALCAHPRKVVGRQARRFYAQQLFLHRIHADLLARAGHLSAAENNSLVDQWLSEVEVLRETQFRLTSRFFRFINRHRVVVSSHQPVLQIRKTA